MSSLEEIEHFLMDIDVNDNDKVSSYLRARSLLHLGTMPDAEVDFISRKIFGQLKEGLGKPKIAEAKESASVKQFFLLLGLLTQSVETYYNHGKYLSLKNTLQEFLE